MSRSGCGRMSVTVDCGNEMIRATCATGGDAASKLMKEHDFSVILRM